MNFFNRSLRHPIFVLIVALGFLCCAFIYGLLVGRYELFPYQYFASFKASIDANPYKVNTYAQRRNQLFMLFDEKSDVVFVGDSHTEAGHWNELHPTLRIANRGINEETTEDVLERMDTVISTQAKTAFIMLGVNDIFSGVSVNTIISNYQSIVGLLKSNNMNVIIQSTVQCHVHTCGQNRMNEVNKLNEELVLLSKTEGVDFLHLGELSDEQGLKDEMTYDGIHLTSLGYRLWKSKLVTKLNTL